MPRARSAGAARAVFVAVAVASTVGLTVWLARDRPPPNPTAGPAIDARAEAVTFERIAGE